MPEVRILLEPDWSEGEWLECPVGKFKGLETRIRFCAPEKYEEWQEKCTIRKTKRGVQVTEIDQDRLSDLITDWTFQEWRGLIDAKSNQEIPCTLPNKKALVNNHRDFGAWAWDMAHDEKTGVYAIKMQASEDAKKTLSGGPVSGVPTAG